MKSFRKILISLVILMLSVSVLSAKEYTITKHKKAMFWTIDSTDSEGMPSRIYVLGTIHLGDNSLYPVKKEVLKAWDNADWIYGEISSEDWNKYLAEMTKLVLKSAVKDPEKQLEKLLTDEEIQILKDNLGIDQYNKLKGFEPWIMNSGISSLVFQKSKLKAEKSYDIYFITKARNENVTMFGLDKLEDQLDLLHYGDRDVQLKFLKNSIEELKNSKESVDMLESMYKAYLTGNITTFEKAYSSLLEAEINDDKDYADYYYKMLNERNIKWAKKFKQILNKGGVTFIFAGCGHFSGEDSTFNYFAKEMANDDEEIEETPVNKPEENQKEQQAAVIPEKYGDYEESTVLIPSDND